MLVWHQIGWVYILKRLMRQITPHKRHQKKKKTTSKRFIIVNLIWWYAVSAFKAYSQRCTLMTSGLAGREIWTSTKELKYHQISLRSQKKTAHPMNDGVNWVKLHSSLMTVLWIMCCCLYVIGWFIFVIKTTSFPVFVDLKWCYMLRWRQLIWRCV